MKKTQSTRKNKSLTRKDKSPNARTTTDHEEDAMSEDTPIGNNKSGSYIDTEFTSFLYFRFKVEASKKGSETMQKKIQSLFKILQIADTGICFSRYKLDIEKDREGNNTPILDNLVAGNTDNIPESIMGMSETFFGARPNSKGRNIWTNVIILHTQPIENIIADTKEDFKEADSSIGL